MATAPDPRSVQAAQQALNTHDTAYSLEKGASPDVQLYHLVASLLEYCDYHGVDLDATVSEVRADLQPEADKCTLPEPCNYGRSCAIKSAREARTREAMYREAGYP